MDLAAAAAPLVAGQLRVPTEAALQALAHRRFRRRLGRVAAVDERVVGGADRRASVPGRVRGDLRKHRTWQLLGTAVKHRQEIFDRQLGNKPIGTAKATVKLRSDQKKTVSLRLARNSPPT